MNDRQDSPTRPPRRSRRRGCWGLLLVGAALLGLSFLPVGPQHAVIRSTLARVVGDLTGREVLVGPVRRSLWRGLEIRGLTIAGAPGDAGPLVMAQRLSFRWSLLRMLLRPWDPLSSIRSATAADVDLTLRREPDGAWELVELFQPKEPRPQRPFTFAGLLRLTNGRIHLIDEAGPGPPVRREFDEIAGQVRFNRRGEAAIELELAAPGLARRVALRDVTLTLKRPALSGQVAIDDLDATMLGELVNPALERWAQLEGGTIDQLGGSFSFVNGRRKSDRPEEREPDFGLDLTAALEGVGLGLQPLGEPLRELTGRVGLRLVARADGGPGPRDEVWFEGLGASLGGSRLALDGRVQDFRQTPTLDLRVASPAWQAGQTSTWLPRLAALHQLDGSGVSSAEVRLTGPVESLRVAGQIAPGGLRWGEQARLEGGSVTFDLERVPPPEGLEGLRGGLEFAGVTLTTQALGQPLEQLSGGLRLGPARLDFQQLRGRVGGAPVALHGAVAGLAKKATRRLDLSVETQGLSPAVIAPLLPAKFRPQATRGGLTAKLHAQGPPDALRVDGSVTLPWFQTPALTHLGGRYQLALQLGRRPAGRLGLAQVGLVMPQLGGPLTHLSGEVTLAPDALTLRDLRGDWAGGTVQAEGRLATGRGGAHDLRVWTTGVDAAQLTRVAGRREVAGRGRLAADLRLRGTTGRFALDGTARLPWLRLPGLTVERADARLALRAEPRRGLAGLGGTVTLRQTAVRPEALGALAEIDRGRVEFDRGRVRLAGVRGRLNGDGVQAAGDLRFGPGRRVKLAGLDLDLAVQRLRPETVQAVAGHLPVWRQVRLTAPLTASLRLSGTPRQLQVRGDVRGGAQVRSEPPLPLAAEATLDLRLRSGQPPVGTVRVVRGEGQLRAWRLPLSGLGGLVTFVKDGRIVLGDGDDRPFRGQIGGSRLGVSGTLTPGEPLRLGLLVDAETVRLDEVRAVLATLDEPPEIVGDEALGGFRVGVVGPLDRLRIATVGTGGEAGATVALPRRLEVAGYTVQGGRAGVDLTLGDGGLAAGRLELAQVQLEVAATGTSGMVDGVVSLTDGQPTADLTALIDGRPVQVRGGPVRVAGARPEQLAFRVRAADVPLAGLWPARAESLSETLESDRLSTDLRIAGPPDDLAIAGTVALGGIADLPPAEAEVHLRLVQPLAGPAAGEPGPWQVLGAVELTGGGVKLAALDEPVRELSGSVEVALDTVQLQGVTATVEGSQVSVEGSIDLGDDPLLDLAVAVPGLDVGELLAAVRRPPADDPAGEPVPLFEALGLPKLTTPSPLAGQVTLRGPLSQVAVGLDLNLPLVVVDAADAVSPGPDPVFPPRTDGQVLLRNASLRGTAIGSLRPAAAALPDRTELAGALNQLAGLTLIGLPGPGATSSAGGFGLAAEAPAAAPEPSVLDSFVIDLTCESDELNPRQGFAFLSEEAQAGVLSDAYTYQPGQGTLEISGPLDQLRFRGRFDLPRMVFQGVPFRRLAARFDYFDHVMTLDQVVADIRGGLVTGQGAMALRASEPLDLAMDLAIQGLDLAVINQLGLAGDRPLDLGGEVSGGVQLHLAEAVPRVQGAVQLDGLTLAGESLGDGVVDFAVEKKLLQLRRVELDEAAGQSHARVSGQLGLSDDGPVDLMVDIRNLDLGRLAPLFSDPRKPAVTGRLDLVGAVTGSRRLPRVAGSGNIFFGSLAGLPFNRLSLQAVEAGEDGVTITGELSDAAYQATLTADLSAIDTQAGSLDYVLAAEVEDIELARALPQAGLALEGSYGRVRGQARFTGRMARQETETGETRLNPLLDLEGEAELSAGQADRPGRLVIGGVVLDQADLKIAAAGDQITFETVEVQLGTTRIGIDPAQTSQISDLSGEQRVALHLVSDELRVEDLVTLTRLPLQTDGSLQVAVDVAGPLREPVAEVRLKTHEFGLNGAWIGNREIRARIARRIAVIEGQQSFDLFGTRVELAASVLDEAIDAQGEVVVHDLPQLRGFLASLTEPVGEQPRLPWQERLRQQLEQLPEGLVGTITARGRLVGSRAKPTGFVELSAPDLHAGEKRVPPVLAMANIGLPMPREPARFDPGVVYVYGSATLGEQASLRLQSRCDGLDLAPYGGWSEKLAGLRGELNLQLQATGTPKAPRLELEQLELAGVGLNDVALASFKVEHLVFRPGLLDIGEVSLADGSLRASLTGQMPVRGLSLRPRRGAPMAFRLAAEVGRLGEFAGLVGSLGTLDGSARAGLTVGGTPAALTLNGGLEVDLPRLELVDAAAGQRPHHRPQMPGLLDALSEAAEAVATPIEAATRPVTMRWEQNAVRLAVVDNTLEVQQFEFHSAPTGTGAGQAGDLWIEPGGTVALPAPLDPTRLAAEGLWSQPIDLRLRARNVSGRAGSVDWSQLGAQIDLEPVFQDGVLNRITVASTGGWVNGGLVALEGEVRQRSATLANWWEQEYALQLATPVVTAGSLPVPPGAAEPVVVPGGVSYPFTFRRRAVGETKAVANLRLETRQGQTPPLTLAGEVEVLDTVVREGALALFAAKKSDGPPAAWPATPELDLTIVAQQNNWLRMKVPELTVPVSARVRLSQTPQQLKMEGLAQVGEGQFNSSFLKNRIGIRGGEAQFTVRRNRFSGQFEPFVTMTSRAETQLTQPTGGGDVERYEVTLNLQGNVRPGIDQPVETEFVVKAESSPPLAEERIFAMLSRKAEFAAALESGELKDFVKQELVNAAFQTALSYALTPVFDELREALGLDVLTVRYELDQALEIQASKYLIKRLLVTLFVEVGGSQGSRQTVKVDYEVAGGYRFGVRFGPDGEFRGTTEYSTRF